MLFTWTFVPILSLQQLKDKNICYRDRTVRNSMSSSKKQLHHRKESWRGKYVPTQMKNNVCIQRPPKLIQGENWSDKTVSMTLKKYTHLQRKGSFTDKSVKNSMEHVHHLNEGNYTVKTAKTLKNFMMYIYNLRKGSFAGKTVWNLDINKMKHLTIIIIITIKAFLRLIRFRLQLLLS